MGHDLLMSSMTLISVKRATLCYKIQNFSEFTRDRRVTLYFMLMLHFKKSEILAYSEAMSKSPLLSHIESQIFSINIEDLLNYNSQVYRKTIR